MTITTNAARGRANRRKGHDAERAVARYLRSVGFPGAERAVRTSYRVDDRLVLDPLDITGIPGTVWSVKDDASNQTARWIDEAERLGHHHGAELAVLVTRRRGKSAVGRWWAWVSLRSLAHAVTGHPVRALGGHMCMELGDLVPMLHTAGYGDPSQENPGVISA